MVCEVCGVWCVVEKGVMEKWLVVMVVVVMVVMVSSQLHDDIAQRSAAAAPVIKPFDWLRLHWYCTIHPHSYCTDTLTRTHVLQEPRWPASHCMASSSAERCVRTVRQC